MKKNLVLCALAAACLLSACEQGSSLPPAPISEEKELAADENEDRKEAENVQTPEDAAANVKEAADSSQLEAGSDSIGPVSFIPNEKAYSMVYGDSTLHAYFMRQQVLPGAGKMIVRKFSDDSIVETIDLQNEASCTVGEQDSMFYLLGWESGSHFVIHLKEAPLSGELYYVNLEEGAFTSQDKTILSKEVSDKETWCYGVADYGIIPSLPSGSQVYVGDVLTARILVRQPAAYAKVENYDENRVRFNEKEFEADGKLEIRIYQIGEDPFTVTFYDAEDNPIGSIRLSYSASMPPEPQQELPQKTITNL